MKLQSRHHALICIALLIAGVMACKSSGTIDDLDKQQDRCAKDY